MAAPPGRWPTPRRRSAWRTAARRANRRCEPRLPTAGGARPGRPSSDSPAGCQTEHPHLLTVLEGAIAELVCRVVRDTRVNLMIAEPPPRSSKVSIGRSAPAGADVELLSVATLPASALADPGQRTAIGALAPRPAGGRRLRPGNHRLELRAIEPRSHRCGRGSGRLRQSAHGCRLRSWYLWLPEGPRFIHKC